MPSRRIPTCTLFQRFRIRLRRARLRKAILPWAFALWCGILAGSPVCGQGGFGGGAPGPQPQPTSTVPVRPLPYYGPQTAVPVVQVTIRGNESVSNARISSMLKTRSGRNYDPELVQQDVRALIATGMFRDVQTFKQADPGGMTITFQVFERPLIAQLQFVGNDKMKEKALRKECGLVEGDAITRYSVEEGRRSLEEFYHAKGYTRATVSVGEGLRPDDRGVTYSINEGPRQRITKVEFVGNTPEIANDARLKTRIQSKPTLLYFFRGKINEDTIEEDVQRLTSYYRALGFFRARVSREMDFDDQQRNMTLRFNIDEGPRYKVRDIRIEGMAKFDSDEIEADMQLKTGEFFNLPRMQRDVNTLRDLYGGEGHIFADIKAEPRFSEKAGELDLVYKIEEGQQYRVGQIHVNIEGDHPHTRQSVVLNRLSLRPGDILDATKLRASERRLGGAQLFLNNPAQGVRPEIVVKPPEEDEETSIARQPEAAKPQGAGPEGSTFRGQSPSSVTTIRQQNSAIDYSGGSVAAEDSTDENNSPTPGNSDHYRYPMRPTQATQAIYNQSPHSAPAVAPAQFSAAPTNSPNGQLWGQPQPWGRPAAGPPTYAPPAPAAPGLSPPGSIAPPAGAGYALPGPRPNGSLPAPTAVAQPTMPPTYGPPGELPGPSGILGVPSRLTDIVVNVQETQTGRLMVGAAVNSDAGITGQIVIDERNFDWRRVPTSWDDWINGTAFRGAGQGFRLEAMPGDEVQRYMLQFTEPYLLNTRVSFNLSAYLFTRRYTDWDEERRGGRLGLGYRLTPDLSVSGTVRGEQVDITDPRSAGSSELNAALGKSDLYSGRVSLINDTRDIPFSPTQGSYVELAFEQVFGTYQYSRGEIDLRRYFLLRERADGSGRHVLGFSNKFGFSGSDTPIFENFFAGGFSTMRGFDFRGASPKQAGITVGGEFQFLGSAEYLFPITADDMLKGVVFVDYGTVEESISLHRDSFRVALGAGLRVSIPAMGPAPIALDFAVPVAQADTDEIQNFSFFVGVSR